MNGRTHHLFLPLLALPLLVGAITRWESGVDWPEPPKVDPGPAGAPAAVPSDAVVLLDGTDLSAWEGGETWRVADGAVTAGRRDLHSKQSFGDCQLHIEFATPEKVRGGGQGRGNSGLFLMGRYEIQILDSYDNETYFEGQAASVYNQKPPMVNASRGPGEWQSYDIVFKAPRFSDGGTLESPARVTVLHNGVVVHHDYEIQGTTHYDRAPQYTAHPRKLPITLQAHGSPVRFRNIWVRELKLD